jgi:hypothetical protein
MRWIQALTWKDRGLELKAVFTFNEVEAVSEYRKRASISALGATIVAPVMSNEKSFLKFFRR